MKRKGYVILHKNGTFYQGWTGIGPKFGGTLKEAKVFEDEGSAIMESGRHWAFAATDILSVGAAKTRDRVIKRASRS